MIAPDGERERMAVYLISYDIAEKDAFEYKGLWEELERLKAVRILYSEWVLASNTTTCGNLYNAVASKTQNKDRLLVVELAKNAQFDKLLISDSEFKEIMVSAR
jgi:hypothetical protein